MEEHKMSETVVFILWIGFSIGVWVLYHKIFTVYYFSLSQGLMKELIWSVIIGIVLTGLALYLWWLVVLILLGVGLTTAGKVDNPSAKKTIMILFAVAAIVVAIVGLQFKAGMKANETPSSSNNSAWRLEKVIDEPHASSYLI